MARCRWVFSLELRETAQNEGYLPRRAPAYRPARLSWRAAAVKAETSQRSGVPGDARHLFFARSPFVAGKHARGDFDQARCELEHSRGIPRIAVARAVFPGVQGIRHAFKRDVLDDHFRKKPQRLHFERVLLQVTP